MGRVQSRRLLHRHARLDQAVEEAPQGGILEVSLRPIGPVSGCSLKLTFQVAKLAILHEEITSLVPINLFGLTCHGSNLATGEPRAGRVDCV